jgi:fructose-bisphosphate aldolase, class I
MVATTAGKLLRWSRFVNGASGQSLIVPIDHGLTLGPIEGLQNVEQIGRWIGHPAIDGVIAHKGLVGRLASAGLLAGRGVMVHLNGATATGEDPDTKHILTSVETAARLGADGVSIQVNFRQENHAHNLGLIGRVVDEAERFGLPVLAMVYPTSRPGALDASESLKHHRHYIRIAYELGVDAVKTAPPELLEDIPALLEGVGRELPILFSGGTLVGDEALFHLAKTAATSGAGGLCVGRNVFQRPNPGPLLAQLREVLDS